jgi:hypothetical protein
MRRFCLAIIALFALAAPAAAGGCCGYGAAAPEIQPVVPVSTYRFDAPPPVGQVYVVNQGPMLSGPGIYAYTNHYEPSFVPAAYPYVGGCGGYGGCGQTYSSGCCGHSYSYSSGCGYGGCGRGYSYGCGYGGCGRGLWSNTTAGYQWNGGYSGYRRYGAYRAWRHHAAPLARAAGPSRGY